VGSTITDGAASEGRPQTRSIRRPASPARRSRSKIPYNLYFSRTVPCRDRVAERLKRSISATPRTMALGAVAADRRNAPGQPRGFLVRRQIRDLHLRVQRRRGLIKGRHGHRKVVGQSEIAQRRGIAENLPAPDAPRAMPLSAAAKCAATMPGGSPAEGLLRRRHDGPTAVFSWDGRCVQTMGSSRPGIGRARPLPEPRRYAALRHQPRLALAGGGGAAPAASRSFRFLRSRRSRRQLADPGGWQPDMLANFSSYGKMLWCPGATTIVVYASTRISGRVTSNPGLGRYPHGAEVWPATRRYSLGTPGTCVRAETNTWTANPSRHSRDRSRGRLWPPKESHSHRSTAQRLIPVGKGTWDPWLIPHSRQLPVSRGCFGRLKAWQILDRVDPNDGSKSSGSAGISELRVDG